MKIDYSLQIRIIRVLGYAVGTLKNLDARIADQLEAELDDIIFLFNKLKNPMDNFNENLDKNKTNIIDVRDY